MNTQKLKNGLRKSIAANKFLLYAIIVFLIAYFIHFLATLYNYFGDYKELTYGIKEKLYKQLNYLERDLDLVKINFKNSDRVSFTTLYMPTQNPYFIYQKDKLLVWSSNEFIPSIEQLRGKYRIKYLADKKGKYLVKRDTVIHNNVVFDIYMFLPLYKKYPIQNEFLSSGYNSKVFHQGIFELNSFYSERDDCNVFDRHNDFLFSINYEANNIGINDDIAWLVLLITNIGILLLVIYAIDKAKELAVKYGHRVKVLFWICFIVGLRLSLLLLKYPTAIKPLKLFNAKFFAYSSFVPSLGDMFLHILCAGFILAIIFYNNHRLNIQQILQSFTKLWKSIAIISLFLFCHLAVWLLFGVIKIIYTNSQCELDITVSLKFDMFKLLCLAIYVLLSLTFFWVSHIILNNLRKIFRKCSNTYVWIHFAIALVIFAMIVLLFEPQQWPIPFISATYIYVVLAFRLLHSIINFEYNTYVYFLVCCTCCAASASVAIFEVNNQKDYANKSTFSSNLLTDSDLYGEFLMKEASDQIKNDAFIRSRFYGLLSSSDLVEQKVKKYYWGKYFDKYEINIRLFDEYGTEKNYGSNENYHQIKRRSANRKFKTEYRNIFLVDDEKQNRQKKYLNFIEIDKDGIILGFIMVEFKLKRVIPNSVYPSLLVDNKFTRTIDRSEFSYCIFEKDTLKYSFGQFNYTQGMLKILKNHLSQSEIQESTFDFKNYRHLVISNAFKRIVVVSSPNYEFYRIFSNFSFWYLNLVFAIMVMVLIYALYVRLVSIKLNFVTKIQIYLNLAFFFPLVVVSTATMWMMASIYRNDLKNQFSQIAEKASDGLEQSYFDFATYKLSRDSFINSFFDIAKYSNSDINLYDQRGRLIMASQSKIYDLNLVTNLINPQAFASILELKKKKSIVNEAIGKLKYYAVYYSLKSPKTGQIIGVLSVPFFETESELETKLISVFNIIINVFTIVFIIFILLSFYATKFLTYPLVLLKQKLQGISLYSDNDPLIWNSKDEIGLLVSEYNKMLLKLQESKQQLARSEKENAWKEMAKQVAHEIKNPLTPMKLSLQYLQMQLKNKNADVQKLTEKTVTSVLEQIDNLSDIASSFSSFAKMPDPKSEPFDWYLVLNQTLALYTNSVDVKISQNIDNNEKYWVKGDAQLMSRIINNLVLNAIQSVPDAREPHIEFAFAKSNGRIRLSISDNGSGIPEEIQDKIFIPNFSTKYYGSGIGLAVAKNGIDFAKGKLWFTTKKDEGTTFYIELDEIMEPN